MILTPELLLSGKRRCTGKNGFNYFVDLKMFIADLPVQVAILSAIPPCVILLVLVVTRLACVHE
jgi:hypothetical protein